MSPNYIFFCIRNILPSTLPSTRSFQRKLEGVVFTRCCNKNLPSSTVFYRNMHFLHSPFPSHMIVSMNTQTVRIRTSQSIFFQSNNLITLPQIPMIIPMKTLFRHFQLSSPPSSHSLTKHIHHRKYHLKTLNRVKKSANRCDTPYRRHIIAI